ncbi:biotin--[acetyl-CoA-carboxylase] ligase [Arachnia propionica]|uniref:biotin--[biotin carboxyl-carrier protein] ligase n=1 Tax=Arachnia propionica TaxID=1750 RepID=A0A3P1T416_9ACTN|nr:biotin--[acetyl-CoA-carboxylase] ligase [Arachnia propionica]RRD04028.1 biotin--[acetyl-CoA-carboxylase] ligase [Arachnia propionica]
MTMSLWREITWVESTGSTNADLVSRARAGATEGTVLVASEQTAGRGRLDRTWTSPAGACVAMSMLLVPGQPFDRWGWLSLLAGMAVRGALEKIAPEPGRVQLKWPNDVLIDGRKVCGILSERVEHPDGARAVVGLGVNITMTEAELPIPTATSLRVAGFPEDRDQLVAEILAQFETCYRRWQETGDVRSEYRELCSSIGAELRIVVEREQGVTGVGYDIDRYGRIVVRTDQGLRTFAVGDVIHARLEEPGLREPRA